MSAGINFSWKKVLVQTAALISLAVVILTLGPLKALAATFVDNSAAIFAGTFSNTMYDSGLGGIRLVSGQSTGTYTSEIKNFGSSATWSNFSYIPNEPYWDELPDNKGADTAYNTSNLNMSGNTALYHFNEAAGATSFTDTSGSGASATCPTACPTAGSTPAIVNTAVNFSSSNSQYLATSSGSLVKGLGQFSISLWVRPSNLGGQRVLYTESTSVSGATRISLRFNGNSVELAGRTNDAAATDTTFVTTGSLLQNNKFYHIVASYDAVAGQAMIYVNNSVTTNSLSLSAMPNTASANAPQIAQGYNLTTKFAGNMDELAIFNRVLSASEVNSMYRRGALQVSFKLRTCNNATCTGFSFLGPNGTTGANDNFNEISNTSGGLPSYTLNQTFFPPNQYFQYRLSMAPAPSTSNTIITGLVIQVGSTYTPQSIVISLSFNIRRSDDAADTNVCDFGTVSTTATATCAYRLKVSTNAAGGYVIYMQTDGTFDNGLDAITSALAGPTGSDISGTTLGTERYGVVVSPGSITGTGSISAATAFNAGTNAVKFDYTSQTAMITSTGQNSPAATDTVNTVLITHRLNISGSTPPGTYTQRITYTVAPTF